MDESPVGPRPYKEEAFSQMGLEKLVFTVTSQIHIDSHLEHNKKEQEKAQPGDAPPTQNLLCKPRNYFLMSRR